MSFQNYENCSLAGAIPFTLSKGADVWTQTQRTRKSVSLPEANSAIFAAWLQGCARTTTMTTAVCRLIQDASCLAKPTLAVRCANISRRRFCRLIRNWKRSLMVRRPKSLSRDVRLVENRAFQTGAGRNIARPAPERYTADKRQNRSENAGSAWTNEGLKTA